MIFLGGYLDWAFKLFGKDSVSKALKINKHDISYYDTSERGKNEIVHIFRVNSQSTYQAQYTATFKKGCWKGEKETISKESNSDISQWLLDYFKDKYRILSVSNVSKVAQHKSKLSKLEQNTR